MGFRHCAAQGGKGGGSRGGGWGGGGRGGGGTQRRSAVSLNVVSAPNGGEGGACVPLRPDAAGLARECD